MSFRSLSLLSVLSLVACGTDDDNKNAGNDPVDDPIVNPDPNDDKKNDDNDPLTAELRVIHASPDAPAVDVYVKGMNDPIIKNLDWGDASNYLSVEEGDYTIELRAAGASSNSAPAYTQDISVAGEKTYTAVAAGWLTSSMMDDQFRILAYEEDFANAAAGNARVRIIHAAPDAPTVALDVGNDGTPEVTDFDRFAETGAAGVELPSGTPLQVGVWAGSPLSRVTAFTTPALPARENLFLIATGSLMDKARDDSGFQLLAVGESGTIGWVRQNPVVYALHASPDAPAVDIFAGGAELQDDLAFGEISAPIQVPPASYTLDFHAHSSGSAEPSSAPAASQATPMLDAGEQYLAIATGFLGGSPGFQLVPVAESFDAGDSEAALRIVHASPDAPAVDVGTVSGGVVTPVADFSGLAFGDASSGMGVALPANTYDFGVAGANTTNALFSFSGLPLMAGDRYIGVAAGALNANNFQLMLVDTEASAWTVTAVQPD